MKNLFLNVDMKFQISTSFKKKKKKKFLCGFLCGCKLIDKLMYQEFSQRRGSKLRLND